MNPKQTETSKKKSIKPKSNNTKFRNELFVPENKSILKYYSAFL